MAAALVMLSQPAEPAQVQGYVDPPTRPYQELICSYPGWDCEKAYRVMWCESKGDPRAYSAGNVGLFQINEIHRWRVGGDASRLYDPEINVAVAHAIYSEQGWSPWGCRGA